MAKEGGLERKVHALVTTEKKRGDPRLKKITWNIPGNEQQVLIQMVGDIRVAEEEELREKTTRPRPMESLIREVEASKVTASPLVERMVREAGNTLMSQRLHTPPSKAAVRLWQSRYRERQGQQDIWENLFRLSREFNFIHLLVASPRILMLQAEPSMVTLAQEILKVSFDLGGGRQCFGLDTQFRVCDLYTTTGTLRIPWMVSVKTGASAVVPFFMYLHDRKYQWDHDLALARMVQLVPQVSSTL